MATTTLPPGAEITLDDHGSGRPPELAPRPARVTDAGSPSQKSETGMWVAVSAIGMSFAAFTSAMFVRQDSSTDWQHFQLPHVLYLNTLILIGQQRDSWNCSRQRFAAMSRCRGATLRRPPRLCCANGHLLAVPHRGSGPALCARAAPRVARPGGAGTTPRDRIRVRPSSTFLPHCTHVHLLGGMGGLFYVLRKLGSQRRRRGDQRAQRVFDLLALHGFAVGVSATCCSRSACKRKFGRSCERYRK